MDVFFSCWIVDSMLMLLSCFRLNFLLIIMTLYLLLVNVARGILLLWNSSKFNINVIAKHDRFLHCQLYDLGSKKLFLCNIPLSTGKEYQLSIWQLLTTLRPSTDEPWLLMGDFNCSLSLQEKLGGIHRTTRYMTQFMHFLNQAQLLSLPCSGNSFTWCNNHQADTRIYERLDRAVVSTSWLTL